MVPLMCAPWRSYLELRFKEPREEFSVLLGSLTNDRSRCFAACAVDTSQARAPPTDDRRQRRPDDAGVVHEERR